MKIVNDARLRALRCVSRGVRISSGIARGMRRAGLVEIAQYLARGQYARCLLTDAGRQVLAHNTLRDTGEGNGQ